MNMMRGYFGNPEATAEAFAGGWFHSGDLGYRDEEGFYFIVDRKKELIIRGGYNVYPREVEEVLYTHPAVAAAAVVGVPDARLGEEVKAYVETLPGATATEQELIDDVKEARRGVQVPADGGVPRGAAQGPDRQDPEEGALLVASPMTVELRDGSRVVIRPIEPDDRAALVAGFERLSPESRYRRFFGPITHLSERDLDYLTRVDHHDHEALVAIEDGTGEGIGVARYVRTGPDVAEPAMVVADDWHGRGAATRLLEALVERAQEEGIRRFEAPVLAYNADAIRVLEALGKTTRTRHGREVELKIELPDADAAARIGPVLKHFASGALAPGRALVERLWPRRRAAPGEPVGNLIVVGTDGSDHAAAAVEAAAALAVEWNATVDVVGVHRFLAPERSDVTAAVQAAAAQLRVRDLSVHEHVRRGDPALVLADISGEQNARLLVVGAGEHSKLARRLIGSVADLVAERSPCNVLIVRPRELG